MDDNKKFAIKDYRDKLYEELIKQRREHRKHVLEKKKQLMRKKQKQKESLK